MSKKVSKQVQITRLRESSNQMMGFIDDCLVRLEALENAFLRRAKEQRTSNRNAAYHIRGLTERIEKLENPSKEPKEGESKESTEREIGPGDLMQFGAKTCRNVVKLLEDFAEKTEICPQACEVCRDIDEFIRSWSTRR